MAKSSIPETSPSPWPITRVALKAILAGILFGVAWREEMNYFSRNSASPAVAIALITLTVGLGSVSVYYLWRWVQGLDEHQRNLQYRATAWVAPVFLLIQFICAQLAQAKVMTTFTWSIERTALAMTAIQFVIWLWMYFRNR